MFNPDKYLIEEVFQHWSDSIQSATGKCCYTIAAIFGVITIIGCNLNISLWIPKSPMTAFIVSSILAVESFELYRVGRKCETSNVPTRPPYMISIAFIRLTWIGMMIWTFIMVMKIIVSGQLAGNVDIFLTIISLMVWVIGLVCLKYFAACMPRPPGWKKNPQSVHLVPARA